MKKKDFNEEPFVTFDVMSKQMQKSLKKKPFKIGAEYDPDLTQNFINSFFGQALPTKFQKDLLITLGLTVNKEKQTDR